MLHDPQPEGKQERKQHPLERRTRPPAPGGANNDPENPRPQRGTLHIEVVKPHVTTALIAVNVGVVIISWLLSQSQRIDFYIFGANNHEAVLQFGEYHRLFTAMFLHGSPLSISLTLTHLFFNMYALWIIGQQVEGFFGHVRYLTVYFLGGMLGSLLSVALTQGNSVGASGAVFAVFGAQIVFLYKHRKLFGEMGRQQLRQLIMIGGINFVIGIASGFGDGVQIDNWGHLGGLLGGVIVAWIIGPVFLLERRPDEPTGFQAVDVNPLEHRIQPMLAYISGLMGVLILTTLIARGGL